MTTIEFVQNGPARIEVLMDGQGPAIVLIPSSQRDSVHETDFAQNLAGAGFTVLRPQPRGMSRSVGPLQGITLLDLASDVAAVIDTLGAGRAVVLGHAFGHTIARVTDMKYPAQVRGVAMIAAAARVAPDGLHALLDRAADAQDSPSDRLEALKIAMFAPGNDPTAWMSGWYPQHRTAYRAAGRSPARADWWYTLNSPMLDLQGAHDPWRPPSTRGELRDALGAKVTVQVIEGASHAMLPERPVQAAAAVASWARALPD